MLRKKRSCLWIILIPLIIFPASDVVLSQVHAQSTTEDNASASLMGIPIPNASALLLRAETLEESGQRLSEKVDQVVDNISGKLGGKIDAEVVWGITWLKITFYLMLFLSVALIDRFVRFILSRKIRPELTGEGKDRHWLDLVFEASYNPISALIWVYGGYWALSLLLVHFKTANGTSLVHSFARKLTDTGGTIVLFWLIYRLVVIADNELEKRAIGSESLWDEIILSLLGKSLRIIGPLLALISLLPLLPVPHEFLNFTKTVISLFIIGSLAWFLIEITDVLERVILKRNTIDNDDNLRARKIYTQVRFLKRAIIVTIGVVALASMLMTFDKVRQFGTSLLASAGIAGIVIGVAAQRSLATMLAGFQVALTQPIRIDDVVIVENEWGRIEEITLTYVVVRIWDLRRLILPINYFLEKPFQNWTRVSADILGTVFIYVDYTVPVQAVREELQLILEDSPLWDRRVSGLVVTNASEQTMELRALMSASNASKAWDLRCHVRERLIEFVQRNYPDGLPKMRAQVLETEKNKREHMSVQ